MKKTLFRAMAVAAVAMLTLSCSGNKAADAAEGQEAAQELAEGEEAIANPEANAAAVDEMTDGRESVSEDGITTTENDKFYRVDMKVDKLTIIDFNATWCVPCRKFEPVFHQAAAMYKDKVKFVSIDIDKSPLTAESFGIQAVPTIVFISPKGGVKQYVGLEDITPLDKFTELIEQSL